MPNSRPHIILIITDQQRYDTIAALGFPHMDTPNLDRLVREGVSFGNCFITAPSCAPSRASLFTGYYPHTTGILKNADRWTRSWVENLNEAGYYCVNVGKMHTYPYHTPLGFHERYVVENKDRFLEERFYFDEWDKALRFRGLAKQQRAFYRSRSDYRERLGAFEWELPEDAHPDNFVGDLACWWLDTKPIPGDKPLFLEIGFPGPHPPYDPIPRYAKPYLEKELPIDPLLPEDLAGQPQVFHQMRQHNAEVDHDSVVHQLNPSDEARHRQRAYYLANVTMIDEQVGAILASLEAKGILDNSVVIFTSDHGDALGDHGHSQKWTMYDIITRVPCVVWSPGRFAGGVQRDELVSWMDLGPTILELAGVEVPANFEAESLLPALQDKSWQVSEKLPALTWRGREYVFAEHVRDGILQGTAYMSMVRSPEWKLVHFVDSIEGQLFDLVADPGEIHNLWDDPEHAGKKNELLRVLLEWRIRSGVKTQSWGEGNR